MEKMDKNTKKKILLWTPIAIVGTLTVAGGITGIAVTAKYKKEHKRLTKRVEEVNEKEKGLKQREETLSKNEAEFQIFDDFYTSFFWIKHSIQNKHNKHTHKYIDKLEELDTELGRYLGVFSHNATEENKIDMKRLGLEAKSFRLELEKQGIFLNKRQEE